jgi:predicted enzyme related to lactoylglutathione lyase
MVGGMFDDREARRAHWLYYFTVDDIEAAATRVSANGGEITLSPHQVPTGDWIIQARDPQGARFALVGAKR